MNTKYFVAIILTFLAASAAFSQRPPGRQGPPPGGAPPFPGRDGRPPLDQQRPAGQPGDWIKVQDSNQNEKLEAEELQAGIDRTFSEFDRNGNGTIEVGEHKFQAGPVGPPPGGFPGRIGPGPQGPPQGDGKRLLPPFFFDDLLEERRSFTKGEFETAVKAVFKQMDRNGDGVVDKKESRPPKEGPGPEAGNPPPNAKFIGAELRFGDKLVKGQPFSAETVIEDTRRLFDGSTVTKSRRGAIYRDGEGRTRREQPLEMVGGVSLAGADNKAPMLIFINDFAAKSHIFLDVGAKIARKTPIGNLDGPPEPGQPENAKTESLGTKTIEGVRAEGTRIIGQIPVGHLGNDKPIEVITEKWFSPELQVVVMSRHVDPIAGEHIFKLVNIRRSEPSADMFAVPSGYRVENGPGKRPEE